MDNVKENINNLSSLWKITTEPFQTYFETESLGYCYINNSQWPNRIWIKQNSIESNLKEVIGIMNNCSVELTFSNFYHNSKEDMALIAQNNFTEKTMQYGMYLKLHQSFENPPQLSFRQVNNKEDIKLWCSAFRKSFGYKINEITVEKSLNNITYINIIFNDEVIGTIILHKTDDIAGIHSLGVIPQMRGKGFAKQAMHYVLNLSIKLNAKTVTLQASEMAKSMYEKLGFTTQFIIRNYKLNK
jgi:ribosomal protein S18 acetylase RimI-like enzyme